ncbi:hypothetical protein NC651_008108 [Populus alba x Populus x berolinensis]|nr:hypothetical protein NC651_008108 [Populus alba x Populus x berolinensis]
MISLNRITFLLSNAGISSSHSPFSGRQRRSVLSVPSSSRVAAVNSNRDPNSSVLMESTFKDVRDGAVSSSSVIDVDSKSNIAPGGAADVYGEDTATEDQVVTPWFVSVAREKCPLLAWPSSPSSRISGTPGEETDVYYSPISTSIAEVHGYDGSSGSHMVPSDSWALNFGMGIPVGKLALYTALGGVRPSACLPVTIDVGTNNENLLNDEYYIGLRQRRATGQEYAELVHEFMSAVKQTYGEKVLIQFEDFANHNAFDLLAKYCTTHLVFNDDIQGTASVVLAGLVAALRVVGGTLADHTFLFLGAGEAGTGIAELIALEISRQTNMPMEEARKKIWLVDSKGLIVSSRKESLQHFKKPWAHEHEPIKTLLDAVNDIKPTVLIGTSGVGRTFTKEVVEAMASFNVNPIILSLSNPTSQSECTAEEAYTWSQGRVIFASGSPFPPVEYEGKTFVPGQANNAYIFPGFGLGLIMSGAIRSHDEMLLAASEALAAQVTQENFDKGLIYPPFKNIRKISAEIAAKVAAKAYELGLATRLPPPKDLVKHAESCMYSPAYRSYR